MVEPVDHESQLLDRLSGLRREKHNLSPFKSENSSLVSRFQDINMTFYNRPYRESNPLLRIRILEAREHDMGLASVLAKVLRRDEG